MTRHPVPQRSRWQVERDDRRDRAHREHVAAELSAHLPPPLTDEQVIGFTGAPGQYVRSPAEAAAHAWATHAAATYVDAAGVLLVSVNESGTIVARGLGRWP